METMPGLPKSSRKPPNISAIYTCMGTGVRSFVMSLDARKIVSFSTGEASGLSPIDSTRSLPLQVQNVCFILKHNFYHKVDAVVHIQDAPRSLC
jgi:hypothetical protein